MSNPIIYVVATPIGNLNDFSPRALEILKQVDFIICEDTRHTKKLLQHFEVFVPLVSLHEHNEKDKSAFVLEKLLTSPHKEAALVTDAGMPGVSDPGSLFVAACHEANVKVITVPGPSALTCALAACGFREPNTLFAAFLERKNAQQVEEFEKWQAIAPCISCFYESPHRLLGSLKNLQAHFGDGLQVCVSREISKVYEEHLRGNIVTIIENFEARPEILGEYVVVVRVQEKSTSPESIMSMTEAVAKVIDNVKNGLRLKDVVKEVAKQYKLDVKDLYKSVLDAKHD